MIRNNLATRPFYNEGAVRIVLLALTLVVAVATVFNVVRIVASSTSDTALASQASRDESRAADIHRQAARLRGTVNRQEIENAAAEARKANALIDRRTFSWTELFNQLETTLPDQARITAVRPQIDPKRGVIITIAVVARTVEDVDQLMERLEATGTFKDLLSPEQHIDQNGFLEATVETTYVSGGGRPAGAGRP